MYARYTDYLLKRSQHQALGLTVRDSAEGNFKLKPLVVYHSENPKVMKGIAEPTLAVIWNSNRIARVTDVSQLYFFFPIVELLCQNNLTDKALLILDKAPGQPVNLSMTCLIM